MEISLRSVLTTGVTAVTASALVMAPSVAPAPAPAAPIMRLTANVQLTAQPADFLAQLIGSLWPSAGRPFPTPPSPTLTPTPTSIAGSLEGAYHAIEPWVRYGFQLAEYAVGWIPYVGWLSGQIMILYNFGEGIVHAIAHNTLDWLGGNGSFWQNLSDGVAETVDAFIQLGIDEWNFFLPPLPPLPPLGLAASSPAATAPSTPVVNPLAVEAVLPTKKAEEQTLVATGLATLEAKLVVTPEAVASSPAEVPASVAESLNAPQEIGPVSGPSDEQNAPAQTPSDQVTSDAADPPGGKVAAGTDEAGAADSNHKPDTDLREKAEKAAKKANKDREAGAKQVGANTKEVKSKADSSGGAQTADPSGPAQHGSGGDGRGDHAGAAKDKAA